MDDDLYMADIPSVVRNMGWDAIRYFGPGDFSKSITRVSFDGFVQSQYARWTGHTAKFALVGDTTLIRNPPTEGFSLVTMVAVLTDPTQACNWPTNDEKDFPTVSPAKLMLVVKNDFLKTAGRADLINDSQIQLNQKPPAPEPQQQSDDQ
jgi:hypothetical protein